MSDKRLIVPMTVNGRELNFLVDTGASVGLISKRIKGLKKGRRYDNVIGAGGKLETYICDTFATLVGKTFSQFLIADIDNIIASIRHETGVEIAGIISLPQMRLYGVEIDTDDNFIRI